jgi:hypothetical protein
MTRMPFNRKDNYDQSLYARYKVSKAHPETDGPDDPKAIYFVLRIDSEGGDEDHIKACQAAAMEFCRRTKNQHMADDLRRILIEQTALLAAKNIARELTQVQGTSK